MYLTNTRPDICFAVNTLSQFLLDSRHVHLVEKHVLRFLKGIVEYGLKYDMNPNTKLEGYVDLDSAGSAIDKKSTSGYCFSMRLDMISEAPICDPDRDLSKEGVQA